MFISEFHNRPKTISRYLYPVVSIVKATEPACSSTLFKQVDVVVVIVVVVVVAVVVVVVVVVVAVVVFAGAWIYYLDIEVLQSFQLKVMMTASGWSCV